MPELSKHEIVLDLRAIVDQRRMNGLAYAFYSLKPEDQTVEPGQPGWYHVKYEMDLTTFEELGKPHTITLNAAPGDMLNE